jgi:putative endonuclease
MKQGHEIVVRNWRKPYGEIDIVSREMNKLHFVEVKAVSWETGKEPWKHKFHGKPEQNIHWWKEKRLKRVIEAYLLSYGRVEWQFDVMAVYVDIAKRNAKVRISENIILGA